MDVVRISKYKNVFVKGYVPNWFEELFVIKKIRNNVTWTYVISNRKGEQIFGTFYQKELQKANQKEVRVLNGKSKIVLLTVGLIKKT